MEFSWEKPVLVFYREKVKKPERKALAVVKARRLVIRKDERSGKLEGRIKDFFPYMGDIDYISSHIGSSNKYVICWMDDQEDDFGKAWRRVTGAIFPVPPVSEKERVGKFVKSKLTLNANFEAESGKLK